MTPDQDPPEARRLRTRLVDELVRRGDARDPRVIAALRTVPRHLFVPGLPLDVAYANTPQPIGYGQTISQPTIVAIMTEAAAVKAGDRVLEIGTGSGYQAAVLATLGARVFSIEYVPELAEESRDRLAALGYAGVDVRWGDGRAGWKEMAPFDAVMLTAAGEGIPPRLAAQLRDGGVLVAPVERPDLGEQDLLRCVKRGDELLADNLGGVRFVPLVGEDPRDPDVADGSGETGEASR